MDDKKHPIKLLMTGHNGEVIFDLFQLGNEEQTIFTFNYLIDYLELERRKLQEEEAKTK